MPHLGLRDVRARLDRAVGHRKELKGIFVNAEMMPKAGLEPFIERAGPPEPFLKTQGERHRYRVRCKVEQPVAWTVLIGDIIHNLRVSLDYLACQLARRKGNPCDKT